ncbi:MAG TPA: amidohydrolase [Bacillota bacterium]|nr:amidohydrolase [Bacillota bacterium]
MKSTIYNIDLLTMNAADDFYSDAAIVIDGDTIEYVGPSSAIPQDLAGGKRIDGKGMLAMPGFVNTHTHIAMTLLRGYADDLPLWEWLNDKVWPVEDKLTGDDVYWATLLGAAEMILSGTTTFSDMYDHMTQVARAVDETGMRAVLARGLMGPTDDKDLEKQRWADVEDLYEWHGKAKGRITTMIAPHSVYTCMPDFLIECKGLAQDYDVALHIHLAETQKEVSDCIEEYGNTPVMHLEKLGLLDHPLLAAHLVHLNDEDIDILAARGVKVAHNPTSNMKLSSGFSPVNKILDEGICVSLGTDGAASNNNLNIWKEMTLSALIAKGYTKDPSALPAKTSLKMATIQGARALSLENQTGSLEKDKKADLILIDTDKPHYHPRGDIRANLVYSGYGQDVDTVIVNGKTLMKNRLLTTIDLDRVKYEVDRISKGLLT